MPSIGREMDAEFLRAEAESWESHSFPRVTDPYAALKLTDEARFRRAHLAKYVKAVVGACALVCAAAFVRVAVGAASEEPKAAVTAQVAAALPAPAPPPPAAVAQPQAPPASPQATATTPTATAKASPVRAYPRGPKHRGSPLHP